ncbi:MAG: hypothetical protein IT372_01745, partial [Polyangiaceae bacterium]|nr:hypothetical protein [Polyangiaceae bacterium]
MRRAMVNDSPLGSALSRVAPAAGALLLIALAGAGCGTGGTGVGLAKGERQDDAPLNVPVPPADGPKLVAVRTGAQVVERPAAGARVLGALAAGAVIARSREPYGKA